MIFTVADFQSDEDEYEDEWLSCPCGSILDDIIAQPDYFNGPKGFGYDVRPVFDCTCPTVPAYSGPTKGLTRKEPRMLFQGPSQIHALSYNHVD